MRETRRRSVAPSSARCWIAALTSALAITVAPSAANADPGAAEALFQKAKTLKEAGKIAEACPLFDESYALDPAPGTLLNIAACSRIAGKTATAWGQFIEAARAFRRKGDDRRAEFADQQAKEVEPLLAHVIVKADKPAPGLVVKRDGAAMTESSFGTKVPIDPGEHHVIAEAPGRKRMELTFEAVARTTKEWVIPELEVGADAPPPGGSDTSAGTTQRIAGFVVGGAGLAGLITGVVFLGLTGAKSGDLEELCPNQTCTTPEAQSALTEAELFANLANGLLIAGGVVAATGLVVILTAPSSADPAPAPATSVTFRLSPLDASLAVRF